MKTGWSTIARANMDFKNTEKADQIKKYIKRNKP